MGAYRAEDGFTLIEVLISILILAVAFLALMSAVSYFTARITEADLREEAVKLAQQCVEQVRHLNHCVTPYTVSGSLVEGSVTREVGAAQYVFRVTYTDPAQFSSGYNYVTVTVSYTYRGKTHDYSIATVVYRK